MTQGEAGEAGEAEEEGEAEGDEEGDEEEAEDRGERRGRRRVGAMLHYQIASASLNSTVFQAAMRQDPKAPYTLRADVRHASLAGRAQFRIVMSKNKPFIDGEGIPRGGQHKHQLRCVKLVPESHVTLGAPGAPLTGPGSKPGNSGARLSKSRV